jgi:hypothetical protein
MTRNDLNVALAAIITTLAETPGEVPCGVLYSAMLPRYTLEDFNDVMHLLQRIGCIDRANNVVCITETGAKLAEQINAAVKA